MQHLRLEHNMRVQKDPNFTNLLLRIGGGTEEVNNDNEVLLPEGLCFHIQVTIRILML
jgi:ATP-dependent DNA helicase PIF1